MKLLRQLKYGYYISSFTFWKGNKPKRRFLENAYITKSWTNDLDHKIEFNSKHFFIVLYHYNLLNVHLSTSVRYGLVRMSMLFCSIISCCTAFFFMPRLILGTNLFFLRDVKVIVWNLLPCKSRLYFPQQNISTLTTFSIFTPCLMYLTSDEQSNTFVFGSVCIYHNPTDKCRRTCSLYQ